MNRAVRHLARLLAASFLMDGSFYLILTVVPLRAIALHASPLTLGLLPVLVSGVYIGAALFFGRLSDRLPRVGMARVGALLRAGVAVVLTLAGSIPTLLLLMPFLGIANGLFWPALQAAIGESRPEEELGRSLGAFNVAWSSGKMLGFLCGGLLIASAGSNAALGLAALLTLGVALLLPPRSGGPDRDRSGGGAPPRRRAADGEAPARGGDGSQAGVAAEPSARRAWRRLGWLANFVLFGIGATLNYQYPKLLLSRGFTARDFGIFLGAIYLFQALSFVLFRRWSGWHFRLWPLAAAQCAALAGVAALPWLHSLGWIWATAPGIGAGLGLSYSSSIYYSLFRESGRGRNTGIHEALLGTGTFLLPLLGGAAAQATGSLTAPYPLCAAVLAATLVAEGALAFSAKRLRRPFPGGGGDLSAS